MAARVLFVLLDVLYGKARTLGKFKVLTLVAGVPRLHLHKRVAAILIVFGVVFAIDAFLK
ncbi:MAG TPA: hypothetical protein VKS82_17235 [Streptosporangiaceae bacterium]|nr:hypothetical protein [Streptosporangiaceae bacterium]